MSKVVIKDEFGWNKVIYISFIIYSFFINLITRLIYLIVHLARKVYWNVIHGEKMRVKKLKGVLVGHQEEGDKLKPHQSGKQPHKPLARGTSKETVKQVCTLLDKTILRSIHTCWSWSLRQLLHRTVMQVCKSWFSSLVFIY